METGGRRQEAGCKKPEARGQTPGAALAVREDAGALWLPEDAAGVTRQRLARFAGWLEDRGGSLYAPDLAAWRDDLLAEGIAPASARAYLATVRSRYRALLRGDALRAGLYDHAGATLARIGAEDSPANRYALVNEALTRLHNAVTPEAARVKVAIHQDRSDASQVRLTKDQAEALLAAPGVGTLTGLRDTALLAVLLCTGLREGEAAALAVGDLRQRVNGELGLLVREGKGGKTRFVPYGGLSWCLVVVDAWLKTAGITRGPVFRGLRKGGRVQAGALTTRAIQQIVGRYPVSIEGARRSVHPHDLRRTYAARQYAAGMDLNALRQNLGHADVKTTLGYIGAMDITTRRGQAVYAFDLRALDGAGQLALL
jgi:site-specific recombinase XerD